MLRCRIAYFDGSQKHIYPKLVSETRDPAINVKLVHRACRIVVEATEGEKIRRDRR